MSTRSALPFGFRYIIIVLLLIGTMAAARAQKEKNIWYFANGLGLDFNTLPPTLLTDGMITQIEGGAAVADRATGGLLFYTDGRTVWNRSHRPMPNGDTLLGGSSATQSALIVQQPGSPSRYFVFSVADIDSTGGYSNRTVGVT